MRIKRCLLALVVPMLFSACQLMDECTYVYKMTNSMQLGNNSLEVMSYMERRVNFDVMNFTANTVDATDDMAIEEFNKTLALVNDEEMNAMLHGEEFYELKLVRMEEGVELLVASKRWPTK